MMSDRAVPKPRAPFDADRALNTLEQATALADPAESAARVAREDHELTDADDELASEECDMQISLLEDLHAELTRQLGQARA
ncbi:MAG: hypothetical protein SPF30_06665 [Arcanobacterium sp.]|nr:hypothetical protein [Arcanobacterium sp.]